MVKLDAESTKTYLWRLKMGRGGGKGSGRKGSNEVSAKQMLPCFAPDQLQHQFCCCVEDCRSEDIEGKSAPRLVISKLSMLHTSSSLTSQSQSFMEVIKKDVRQMVP
jgi:hypothetical protein